MAAPMREGYRDHLATKSDMSAVLADMECIRVEMERLRAHIARRIFLFGVAVIGAIGVAAGITSAVIILA